MAMLTGHVVGMEVMADTTRTLNGIVHHRPQILGRAIRIQVEKGVSRDLVILGCLMGARYNMAPYVIQWAPQRLP